MIRTLKYRLYPNKEQERLLTFTLDRCRELYNALLEERILAYKKGVSLNRFGQQKELVELKQVRPEYKEINSQVLKNVVERLDITYQNFFRRVKKGLGGGFPRFQGKNRYDSFTYPSIKTTNAVKIVEKKVKITPFEEEFKVRWDKRPLPTNVKIVTIKRELNEWYITFCCELENDTLEPTGNQVGIDMGTVRFLTTSDGEFVENPRFLKNTQQKLRVQQRNLSRKKNGSNRRKKNVETVAKTHRKVRRQRLDFHHKISRKLVNENDLIVHEKLKVSNMVKSNLAFSISDVGWSQFLNILSYKAESAGRKVIAVDPRFTSQMCSKCGHVSKENRESQAKFSCKNCGHEENADHNAALNILAKVSPSDANVVH